MQTLDFAHSFQLAHPKSAELASRLASLLPGDLNHLSFVSSGSEAVDTAIKLAVVYHRANREPQHTLFVSRERAYHGVNLGGTSLAGIGRKRHTFEGITLNVCHMRHTWNENELFVKGQPQGGAELAEDLLRFAELHGAENIAACIIKPIAGSTGMLVPPAGYLERLREICDETGILLIFDEVITGFGRVGSLTAAEAFDVLPDIMTMARGISNATIPLGAVAARKKIYDTLVSIPEGKGVEFFHGYTYSGHPVACSAALATLDILEKEKIFEHVAALSPCFLDTVFSLGDIPAIRDIRGYGLLAAIELKPEGPVGNAGMNAAAKLFDAGLLMRFAGDCGMISPPLISEKSHIEQIVEIISKMFSA